MESAFQWEIFISKIREELEKENVRESRKEKETSHILALS